MPNSSKSKDLDAIVLNLINGFYFEDENSSFRIVETNAGYVSKSKSNDNGYLKIKHLPDVRNKAEAYGKFIAEVYEHLCKEVGMEKAAYFVAMNCKSEDLLKN